MKKNGGRFRIRRMAEDAGYRRMEKDVGYRRMGEV